MPKAKIQHKNNQNKSSKLGNKSKVKNNGVVDEQPKILNGSGKEVLDLIVDLTTSVMLAKSEYARYTSELSYYDQLVEDYLHILELENESWSARAKVATQLADARKKRRIVKNELELLQPIIAFANTDYGKKVFDSLRTLSGNIRSVDKRHNQSTYKCRILHLDEDGKINLKPPKREDK